jgi:hypothetical protein
MNKMACHITDGTQFDDIDDPDFPEDDEYEDDQPDAFGLRAALQDIGTPERAQEYDEAIRCKRCKIIKVRDYDDMCASCQVDEIEHLADAAREQV